MGASTVTGAGLGSSIEIGGVRGPGNLRNQFVPLCSPRVVACATVTLSAANPGVQTATVTVPTTSSVGDFYVLTQDVTAAAAVKITSMTVSAGVLTIVFAGATSDVINYAVITNSNIW